MLLRSLVSVLTGENGRMSPLSSKSGRSAAVKAVITVLSSWRAGCANLNLSDLVFQASCAWAPSFCPYRVSAWPRFQPFSTQGLELFGFCVLSPAWEMGKEGRGSNITGEALNEHTRVRIMEKYRLMQDRKHNQGRWMWKFLLTWTCNNETWKFCWKQVTCYYVCLLYPG